MSSYPWGQMHPRAALQMHQEIKWFNICGPVWVTTAAPFGSHNTGIGHCYNDDTFGYIQLSPVSTYLEYTGIKIKLKNDTK